MIGDVGVVHSITDGRKVTVTVKFDDRGKKTIDMRMLIRVRV